MKNPFKLFKKPQTVEKDENDLRPRGVATTIKAPNHGTAEHFNDAFHKIYSQTRNLDIL